MNRCWIIIFRHFFFTLCCCLALFFMPPFGSVSFFLFHLFFYFIIFRLRFFPFRDRGISFLGFLLCCKVCVWAGWARFARFAHMPKSKAHIISHIFVISRWACLLTSRGAVSRWLCTANAIYKLATFFHHHLHNHLSVCLHQIWIALNDVYICCTKCSHTLATLFPTIHRFSTK